MLFYLYEICIADYFYGFVITYDEVGNPLIYRGNTLTWNFGRRLASFGNITYTYNEDGIRNLNPFRYRGYYYDTDTSLYYLQSRYYDPETGRFLNSDDVNFIGTTESEISYNPFAYCENDPVNAIDPTGKAMINAVCAAIGAIAGWYFGAWIANRLGYTVKLDYPHGGYTWHFHVIGRDRFKYHIQVSKSTWDILKKLLG